MSALAMSDRAGVIYPLALLAAAILLCAFEWWRLGELDALHKRIEALERSRDPVRPARKPAARTRTHADGGNE